MRRLRSFHGCLKVNRTNNPEFDPFWTRSGTYGSKCSRQCSGKHYRQRGCKDAYVVRGIWTWSCGHW